MLNKNYLFQDYDIFGLVLEGLENLLSRFGNMETPKSMGGHGEIPCMTLLALFSEPVVPKCSPESARNHGKPQNIQKQHLPVFSWDYELWITLASFSGLPNSTQPTVGATSL